MKKETRKNSLPIKVYCTPKEREQICSNATAVGLSLSGYLLKVGMGYQVKGVLDHRRIDDLARVNGDLGRLGGLLKLWLTNDEKLAHFDHKKICGTILNVMGHITENQKKLREIMLTVVRS